MVDMWIRVEEGLPEVFRNERGELLPFLVSENHSLFPHSAFYDGKAWTDDTGELDVTHWMPLPRPPKEARNEQ